MVPVDNRNERAELELTRGHRGFPDLPLGQLAVPGQAVNAERMALHPRAERHPDAHREPVTKRSGAEVDASDLAHVRVVAERAVQARVVMKKRAIEEANIGQDRIETDGGVALAEDESVALRPGRVLWPVAQLGVVQRREQLSR